MRAGQSHRVHVGLAAGAQETQLVRTGNRIADNLSELDSRRIVREKRHAAFDLLVDRCDDLGMAVTQHHRTGADQVVDVFPALVVPDAAPLAVRDKDARIEIAEAAGR